MKKKFIFVSLILFTGYILVCPKDAVRAAADGLVLWYEQVLPTLLPFAILSNVLIYSNYLQYVTRYTAPVIRRLFPVSENGAFVLFSGFLFGFPMGQPQLRGTAPVRRYFEKRSRRALHRHQ